MAIYLYTGTPGSGKSYNVARDINNKLKLKKNNHVLANFQIDLNNKRLFKKGKKYNFNYFNSLTVTPNYFVEYFKENLVRGTEGQALIIFDEAQLIFNSREWQTNKDRMSWIQFFSQHRKFGYNVILITQNDRMIDRQIRSLAEYQVVHRKVNNFKFGFLPITIFISIQKWYGIKETIRKEFFVYNKKIGGIYDSYTNWAREDLEIIK